MVTFKKLEYSKKREYVATQILEAIQRGELKVGDKLPPEQTMAENIGVSRPSIREALGALRIVGIIETINGVGTVVRKDQFDLLSGVGSQELSSILGYEGNTFEILEARKVIEPAVAIYALENLTREHLSRVEGAMQMMFNAVKQKDYLEYHEANKRFHLSIATASQNSLLIQSVNSLLHLFTDSDFGAELRRRYLTDDSYIAESLNNHRRIFNSLKSNDRLGLIQAYKEHDRQVEKQLIGQ